MRILLFLGTNIAILAVLSVTLQLLGIESILDEQGVDLDLYSLLIFSAIIGATGSFISLALSKWSAKRMMGVQLIVNPKNSTEQWLHDTVAAQAQQKNIQCPEIGLFESPQPNAFATGMSKNSSLVAVSTGLIQHMDRDQVEAVLAHEISHIVNGDMVTMALIQGVINTFVIFFSRVIGHVVDRVVFKVQRGHGPAFWITSIIVQILLSILASIIVMWFSRKREFRADEGGAGLAGREKMISALERLKETSQAGQLPDEIAAYGIAGAKTKSGFKKLFMSHPPLDERIRALQLQD